MASIREKPRKDGTMAYLVRIRFKGLPMLAVTFDDLDEAYDWVVDNEWEFRKDPESYFEWKEKRFWDMKKKGRPHLKRPIPWEDKIFC